MAKCNGKNDLFDVIRESNKFEEASTAYVAICITKRETYVANSYQLQREEE